MISFSAPWALAGLGAVLVPLILHLVARREPPVVAFPAVRYLEDTARRHHRRFRLQHWLLLLVRMALLAALVLAAAGPSRAGAGPGGHAPAALVLVLDNSASSGLIQDGVAVLEELRQAARRILARAGPDDELWLVTAQGPPRRGDPRTLAALVDSLASVPHRLDLGGAVGDAAEVLAGAGRPGEVIVLTDLQVSSLSPAPGHGVLVGRPVAVPPSNLGVAAIETGPQPWMGAGRVTVELAGDSTRTSPVALVAGTRTVRQFLLGGGAIGTAALSGLPPGWHPVEASLDPDELRSDDRGVAAIRVAPPAGVAWPPGNSYLATAMEVLEENGRIVRGGEVVVDRLGPGASVVLPPADPADLGAANRALAARGVPWRFGDLIAALERSDSATSLGAQEIRRRYRLVPAGTPEAGTVLTVGGEPWLVRAGDVVLVGSRLDPVWTGLPLTAEFMPFVDLLVNRLARGESARIRAVPGGAVMLPDAATAVADQHGAAAVEGGSAWLAGDPGLAWILRGADTVGVIEVNLDPRESRLDRASDSQLGAIWPGVRVASPAEAAALAFTVTARADLRAPLLWLALALGLAELALAGAGRRRS